LVPCLLSRLNWNAYNNKRSGTAMVTTAEGIRFALPAVARVLNA
jgi:hypothetical protein